MRGLGGMRGMRGLRGMRGMGRNERAGKNERAESSDFFQKRFLNFLSIEKNLLTCNHNV